MTNREIDELIAEKVMGLSVCWCPPERESPRFDAQTGRCLTCGKESKADYSTSIVASKQLRDKVHADGWYWALDGRQEKERAPFKSLIWRKAAIPAPMEENFFSARSYTEEMAVALSVLKAYGVEISV